MKSVLHLTLLRKWFDLIEKGEKKEEYREMKPYWVKRLEGKKYSEIYFKNGYSKNAPFMRVEWKGVRKITKNGTRTYAISLGKILEKGNIDKFNKLGWFKCVRDSKTGAYTKIVFGAPINFNTWISGVKKGLIYFDSGMYVGNGRPYSQWRADNKYWDSLIIETY